MTTTEPRKGSKFEVCTNHARAFAGDSRRRMAETFVEGGPGGTCDQAAPCRLWPGTDFYAAAYCHGELELTWTRPAEACPKTGRSATVCADPTDHTGCPDLAAQAEDPAFGHCDTCGTPCDVAGCTADRQHAAAIDPFETCGADPLGKGEHLTSRSDPSCRYCGADMTAMVEAIR